MDKNLNFVSPVTENGRHEDMAANKLSTMKPRLMRELSLTPLLAAMLAACGGGGSGGGGGFNLTPTGGGGGGPRSYELMRAPAPQTGSGAPQAGNQGIAGDDDSADDYEAPNAGNPGGTYSGSNSDDAGNTIPPQTNVPPIPDPTIDWSYDSGGPTDPHPGTDAPDAGKDVGSAPTPTGQAGNNGQIAGQASPQDGIEPSNAPVNDGDGASSGSNSDDAGDTIPPQDDAPPIPNLSMDEPDGDSAPVSPPPGQDPANAGSGVSTSPNGPTIVTDFRSIDTIRVDATDAQKQAIDAAQGNDAKLAEIGRQLDLRWVNNADYDSGTGSNDATVHDTVIYDTGGTATLADDVVLMVLEDYTTDLTATNFDIV
jgi:hypothetical protein